MKIIFKIWKKKEKLVKQVKEKNTKKKEKEKEKETRIKPNGKLGFL
jgi:hypothetical protein